MLRFAFGLMAVSLVATAALCGGKAKPAPVSDEEFRAAAEAAVTASLLTLKDLPAAWIGTPPEPDEDDPKGEAAFRAALTPACQDRAGLYEDTGASYPGAVIEKASDDFEPDSPDGPPDNISSDAGVYRTEELATADWDRYYAFLADCGAEFPDAIRAMLATDPEWAEIEIGEIGYLQVDAPDLGERAERTELSMVAETQGLEFQFTVVSTSVHIGRMIVTVEWTDFGDFDTVLGETLTTLVADRLAKADGTLPE